MRSFFAYADRSKKSIKSKLNEQNANVAKKSEVALFNSDYFEKSWEFALQKYSAYLKKSKNISVNTTLESVQLSFSINDIKSFHTKLSEFIDANLPKSQPSEEKLEAKEIIGHYCVVLEELAETCKRKSKKIKHTNPQSKKISTYRALSSFFQAQHEVLAIFLQLALLIRTNPPTKATLLAHIKTKQAMFLRLIAPMSESAKSSKNDAPKKWASFFKQKTGLENFDIDNISAALKEISSKLQHNN